MSLAARIVCPLLSLTRMPEGKRSITASMRKRVCANSASARWRASTSNKVQMTLPSGSEGSSNVPCMSNQHRSPSLPRSSHSARTTPSVFSRWYKGPKRSKLSCEPCIALNDRDSGSRCGSSPKYSAARWLA